MIHREKELRARMRWVVVVSGLILMAVVVGVLTYTQRQPKTGTQDGPLEKQN